MMGRRDKIAPTYFPAFMSGRMVLLLKAYIIILNYVCPCMILFMTDEREQLNTYPLIILHEFVLINVQGRHFKYHRLWLLLFFFAIPHGELINPGRRE